MTLWRDWLTDEVISGFNLNDRQIMAVREVKNIASMDTFYHSEIDLDMGGLKVLIAEIEAFRNGLET